MMVRGMPKVRVGDFWAAALKDEGWRYVIALTAAVTAIGSNQEQPKGNSNATPMGTVDLAIAVRAFIDWVNQFHWK